MRTAIGSANVNQAKGSFDGPTRASTIDANDQLKSVADYENLIIAYRNGAPIRLKDVAKIVNSAENVQLAAWANERAAIILNIQRQPGANVIEVVDRIKQLLPQLQASLPGSIEVIPLDRPHGNDPCLRGRCADRAVHLRRPGGDGRVSLSAQHPGDDHSRAWPFRFRSSAPSA